MKQFKFNDLGTYETWGLLLAPSYVIEVPKAKTIKIPVPGRSGDIDLTEVLNGGVAFENRNIEATFVMMPTIENRRGLLTTIAKTVHGKVVKIFEPDIDTHYYIGRISVGALEDDHPVFRLPITAECEPYRYKKDLTVITEVVVGTQIISLANEEIDTVPRITSSAPCTIRFKNAQWSINEGTNMIALVLSRGINELTVIGDTTITFEYQEGSI